MREVGSISRAHNLTLPCSLEVKSKVYQPRAWFWVFFFVFYLFVLKSFPILFTKLSRKGFTEAILASQ